LDLNFIVNAWSENNALSTGRVTGTAGLTAAADGELDADGDGETVMGAFELLPGSTAQPATRKSEKAKAGPSAVYLIGFIEYLGY
jgi:hypothetical protein